MLDWGLLRFKGVGIYIYMYILGMDQNYKTGRIPYGSDRYLVGKSLE